MKADKTYVAALYDRERHYAVLLYQRPDVGVSGGRS
jgi:hypothetical protein